MSAPGDVIHELHASSLALLSALRERSPQFLEHLERRESALRALRSLPAAANDMPLLQSAAAAGEAASLEAQRMRQEAVDALNRLHSQHLFSQGLSAGTGAQYTSLDVKA